MQRAVFGLHPVCMWACTHFLRHTRQNTPHDCRGSIGARPQQGHGLQPAQSADLKHSAVSLQLIQCSSSCAILLVSVEKSEHCRLGGGAAAAHLCCDRSGLLLLRRWHPGTAPGAAQGSPNEVRFLFAACQTASPASSHMWCVQVLLTQAALNPLHARNLPASTEEAEMRQLGPTSGQLRLINTRVLILLPPAVCSRKCSAAVQQVVSDVPCRLAADRHGRFGKPAAELHAVCCWHADADMSLANWINPPGSLFTCNALTLLSCFAYSWEQVLF
jgi:hypothetical protein